MNGEQSVLDRIDEVTVDSCHAPGCSRSLADSVSPYFCGPQCQQSWTAHQNDVQELTGYIEPLGGYGWDAARWRPEGAPELGTLRIPDWPAWSASIHADTSEAARELRRLADEMVRRTLDNFRRTFEHDLFWGHGRPVSMVALDEAGRWSTRLPVADEVALTGRLDLSWLDHYVPALDEPQDQVALARKQFPELRVAPALTEDVPGPQVHADPRRNRR